MNNDLRQKIEQDLKNIFNLRYSNSVSYDYSTINDCGLNGCNIEEACRCGVIVDLKITSVNFSNVVNSIYSNIENFNPNVKENEILIKYGIEVIAKKNELYDKNNYEVNTVNGYYGEEIGNIDINSSNFEKELLTFLKIKNNNNKIEYLLKLEYTEVLPEYKDKIWDTKTVPIDKIKVNEDYIKRLKNEALGYLTNICDKTVLVKKEGGFYKLIDGYHKYLYILNDQKNLEKEIKVIFGQ